MKVRIYFKGLLKGSWILDFVNIEVFRDYLKSNKLNIKKYEIM